jgi:hypothetical protein
MNHHEEQERTGGYEDCRLVNQGITPPLDGGTCSMSELRLAGVDHDFAGVGEQNSCERCDTGEQPGVNGQRIAREQTVAGASNSDDGLLSVLEDKNLTETSVQVGSNPTSPALLDAAFEAWAATLLWKNIDHKNCALAGYKAAINTMNQHLGYTPEQVRELVEASGKLAKWAENFRACGDAGFWDWEANDEYSILVEALRPFTSKGGM